MRGAHVQVEPVLLDPLGQVHEVERPGPRGFLPVEIMARDAAEAFLAHHLVARVPGFLEVREGRQLDRLEVIHLGEEPDQPATIRLAELRHRRVDIRTLAVALEQHGLQAGRRQLRPDVGQGRRQAALVAEGRRGAAEEGVALRRDAAEATALVAGEAVKTGELAMEGRLGRGLRGEVGAQRRDDPAALLGREVVAHTSVGGDG